MELIFEVENTKLVLKNRNEIYPLLVGGNSDYLCRFTFSSEWDGLMKTIFFYNTKSKIKVPIVLDSDECEIPYSVLSYGELEISATATDGNEEFKTSVPYTISVCRTIVDNDEIIVPPTDDVYDQIVGLVANFGGQCIDVIYINQNDELICKKKNGEEVNCGKVVASEIESISFSEIDRVLNGILNLT